MSAGHQHRGRSIAKQNGRDQVGLRNILALKSQRGELHGNNQDVAARVCFKEIGGAPESHGTGGATQFGERHSPNVGAKAHQIDQMGVKRGNHETGAGNRDD